MPPPKPWKTDNLDLDAICDQIRDNVSLTKIADGLGIHRPNLSKWIAADESRSARVNAARAESGHACSDDAIRGIEDASDPFALAKARERAQHLRWHASKISPQYGDKSTVTHAGAVAHLGAADISDAERGFITEQLKREAE